MVSIAADPLRGIYSHLIHQKLRKKIKEITKLAITLVGLMFTYPDFIR